jgi:hypothetical protein
MCGQGTTGRTGEDVPTWVEGLVGFAARGSSNLPSDTGKWAAKRPTRLQPTPALLGLSTWWPLYNVRQRAFDPLVRTTTGLDDEVRCARPSLASDLDGNPGRLHLDGPAVAPAVVAQIVLLLATPRTGPGSAIPSSRPLGMRDTTSLTIRSISPSTRGGTTSRLWSTSRPRPARSSLHSTWTSRGHPSAGSR